MPYKPRRASAVKKVVVKPKVSWTLQKKTDYGVVTGPSKSNFWTNGNTTTYTTKDLIQAEADNGFVPGMTKKIKHLNIEVSRTFTNPNSELFKYLTKMKCYIMYLPQGVPFNGTYDQHSGVAETIAHHPEWIIAEKILNCNYHSDSSYVSNITVKCKLSRNLKSGDKIVCVLATSYTTAGLTTGLETYGIPFSLEWNYAQSH